LAKHCRDQVAAFIVDPFLDARGHCRIALSLYNYITASSQGAPKILRDYP